MKRFIMLFVMLFFIVNFGYAACKYSNTRITRVIDGDTVEAAVNVGFNITVNETFRIYGVDTPESFGKDKCEKGIKVKKIVKDKLEGKIFNVTVMIKDKYGRWLMDIEISTASPKMLSEWLILNGHAKEYYGGHKEENK